MKILFNPRLFKLNEAQFICFNFKLRNAIRGPNLLKFSSVTTRKCLSAEIFFNECKTFNKKFKFTPPRISLLNGISNKRSIFLQNGSNIRISKVSATPLSPDTISKPEEAKDLKFSKAGKLFALAKPEAWTITGGIAFLAVSSCITMAVPFALGHVIDIIYTADALEMKQNLKKVCLGLVGIFLTGGLANFGRVYLLNVAGQRIIRSLRANVFSSLLHQETAFFDTARTGELINRLSADTTVVSQAVTMNVSDGLRSTVMIAAGVGMMFYMSTDLAIVGLSVVPPVALMAIAYGRYLRSISKQVQDTLAGATQVAEERISNIRTVRAFGQEHKEIGNYKTNVDNVLALTYKESLAKGIFFGLTGLSGNVIILSVLFYGGTLVTESALTIGQLSSFLLYAAYVGIAFGGLSSFYSELNKGLGASTRLFELLERKPAMPLSEGIVLPYERFEGHVEFRNVSFSYPSRTDRLIFDSFSLTVPKGKVIALVGASGSGKSTVAALLLRMYDPQAGEILIDSTPIQLMDPTWLRSVIASVSQEPTLFSTSILNNILYGKKDPSRVPMEEVLKAAREANALSFIEGFPQKFETLVGEKGVMLSGGQKQRIAIARAIINDPKILILDEATSALDSESESLVQEALEKLMNGKTVITIAHRLSTIRNADCIAVLQDGSIVESGSYHELMARQDGVFKRLVERQAMQN